MHRALGHECRQALTGHVLVNTACIWSNQLTAVDSLRFKRLWPRLVWLCGEGSTVESPAGWRPGLLALVDVPSPAYCSISPSAVHNTGTMSEGKASGLHTLLMLQACHASHLRMRRSVFKLAGRGGGGLFLSKSGLPKLPLSFQGLALQKVSNFKEELVELQAQLPQSCAMPVQHLECSTILVMCRAPNHNGTAS